MSMLRKDRLKQIINQRAGDMELTEFNLVILLASIITENLIIFLLTLFSGYETDLVAPLLIIMAGCGLVLLVELFFARTGLAALASLIILNVIAVPMILSPGHSVYSVATMWFAASMLIAFCVFKGVPLFLALGLFVCECIYLYGNILFPENGTLLRAADIFRYDSFVVCFMGIAFMIGTLVIAQNRYYRYQREKIGRSSRMIERAGNAKREFLANMSDEIRTPMNSIINFSEIMLKGEYDGEIKSEINTVRSSAYDLLTVIDDVLTYARIDAGNMHLIEDTYSLDDLVQQLVRTVSEEIQKKKLTFNLTVDGDIPRLLVGDIVTVRQIFLYLLFISIDFTLSGRILLDIHCERDEDRGEAVFSCRVADTGKGMSGIDIQSLFGMYDTYDSRQSSNLKGVGLKFTICKGLLAMMQGDISVESISDVGMSTSFTFRQKIADAGPLMQLADDYEPAVLIYDDSDLGMSKWQNIVEMFHIRPTYCHNYHGFDQAIQNKKFDFIFIVDRAYENLSNIISLYQCQDYTYVLGDFDAVYGDFGKCRLIRKPLSSISVYHVLNHMWNKEDYKKSSAEETFTARKAKVLVVDDNAVNLKVAAGIFGKYGIDIAVATRGEDGIKKIESEKYDLILMDMVMPDMSGSDVLKTIRNKEDNYYKEVPFVALTAQNGASVREEMLQLGFQEYLAKPIKRRYLEKCLLEFLPEELIEHVKVPDGDAKKADQNSAAERKDVPQSGLNTDKGLLNIGFNQEAYAAILNTYYAEGIKYIDLLPKLLEAGDIQLFTTDVHGIKSSSASIGAMEVSALFKELEFDGKAGDTDAIRQKFDGYLEKFKEILEEVKKYLKENGRFSEEEVQDDLADKEIETLTAETLQNLKTELDKMNMKVTDELVPELASRNFGPQMNAAMRKLKEAYDMFDFHQVKAIVNEMMEKV